MRTVLHVTWEYPPWSVGGISQALARTLPAIATRLPMVLAVRADSDGTAESGGMRIYKVGTSIKVAPHILAYAHSLNVDLVRGASTAIHENDIALVHTHDWISSIAGVYLKSGFQIPLMTTVYSTELTRTPPPYSLTSMGICDIEKQCFQKADALAVMTREVRDHLIREYFIDPGKIFVSNDTGSLMALYDRWLK